MSEWITDRRPTRDDAYDGRVWYCGPTGNVRLEHWSYIGAGLQINWMPIAAPEPYVKPKRFTAEKMACTTKFDSVMKIRYAVYDNDADLHCALYIHSREAAERIAAIYQEVMP